jgi:hypothetical protein
MTPSTRIADEPRSTVLRFGVELSEDFAEFFVRVWAIAPRT